MRHTIFAALAAITLGAASLQAQAPATLSLEEALALAREHNPDYRIQEGEVQTARGAVRTAYGNLLPSASVGTTLGYTAAGERRFGDVSLGDQPERSSTRYDLGLSLNLSGQSILQPGIERDRARAAEARLVGVGSGLAADVTQAYLSVLQADAEFDQARREVERTGTYVRQAEAQLEVGSGTPLDVRRAEVQHGQAEVRLLQAETAVLRERTVLGRLIGVMLEDGVELTSDFDLFEPRIDEQALARRAADGNPALHALRVEADVAGSQIRAAQSRYLPSLNMSSTLRSGSAAQEGSFAFPSDFQGQPWSMQFTVSLPVFTGFERGEQVQAARVAERNADLRVRQEELRLQTEVKATVRGIETAYRSVELQERVRETAAEELRLAQERFRHGLGTSVEVVDAQANLAQAERDEIDALYEYHKLIATLEVLVGEPLRNEIRDR